VAGGEWASDKMSEPSRGAVGQLRRWAARLAVIVAVGGVLHVFLQVVTRSVVQGRRRLPGRPVRRSQGLLLSDVKFGGCQVAALL